MAVSRYYVEDRNPDGATLPGVPLADLDEETFDAYPAWLQASIDASPFYRKSKPDSGTRAAKSDKET